jgi:hypothetical protein
LRELLLYITHEALEGRPEELSELRIAIRVFGRPQSYNPADDNIVRVAARQLRSKLKEYFESEGRDESLVLDIPEGGYVLVFLVGAELVQRRRSAGPPSPEYPLMPLSAATVSVPCGSTLNTRSLPGSATKRLPPASTRRAETGPMGAAFAGSGGLGKTNWVPATVVIRP